jgi:hypothetical protein
MMSADDLAAALGGAFPLLPIDLAMLEDPSSNWDAYDERSELAALVGSTWADLPPQAISRHAPAIIYAGDRLFHELVPAFLAYSLGTTKQLDDVRFQLASQLTRREDVAYHGKFDRRLAYFTIDQRTVVRDTVAHLATRPALAEVMTPAADTCERLANLGY